MRAFLMKAALGVAALGLSVATASADPLWRDVDPVVGATALQAAEPEALAKSLGLDAEAAELVEAHHGRRHYHRRAWRRHWRGPARRAHRRAHRRAYHRGLALAPRYYHHRAHGARYRYRHGAYRYFYDGWWYARPWWLVVDYNAYPRTAYIEHEYPIEYDVDDRYDPNVYERGEYASGGRCNYWSDRCIENWGFNNPNYRGCMRYHGCD